MQRFWDKVTPVNGCWHWSGARNKDGYGSIGYGRKTMLAHRFAYQEFIGEIPPGMCVLHRCDEPSCVNPGHLFLGTQADNVADCAAKGRRNQSRLRKLTPEQRNEIREWYAKGGYSQDFIGRVYGVSQATVSYTVRSA